MIQIQHGQVSDPIIPTSGGMSSNCSRMVVLAEARPGRFPGWLIGCFRCFTLLPSGERSSPLGASADVQVFSVVFTFGACSSSILGAHHSGDRGGARTLDPLASPLWLIPRFFFIGW